ncbi:undecaprenyl diphosphate synthase [Lasallia pustulata]|uniref:Alkyl transferase n=1 Tax=Lasallia pustulata TaxID=136370 RepID=A0A1W5D823_9LECA|nr:undecaprenyl diphosphate synthase [Lasallia pustulata]
MPSLHLAHLRKWIIQSPPAEWAILQLRELLIGALRQGPVPQHVAFVMDGNRRFARSHQIETVEGHHLGFEALARILEVCYKSGVKVVTIYAFSIENFKRSKYEVDALMEMAKVKLSQLAQHGDLLDRYGASIRILGQRELVKPDVLQAIDRAVELTSRNGQAILNVCFPYTSRDEITTAIRNTVIDYSKPLLPPPRPFSEAHISHNIRNQHLATAAARLRARSPSSAGTSDTEDSASTSTTLHPDSPPQNPSPNYTDEKHVVGNYPDPESITPQVLDDHMFTAGTPPLDLLVRTSGVERLSDFMLWQCHQNTEIVFLKCLWPEFDLWTFLPVLVEWQWRRTKVEETGKAMMSGSGRRKAKKMK